ncbi:hypothetical protein NA8A_04555 [Nitratireductor indicus C115]|uniref:Glycosyltransferase RgtA/B/C/D-like domain-containing protein n=1 Tax=Nitratireductor indicus C115 TaxID=1231190 RepID=K2N986_9HYPH|nr:hypothetical protein [Nitratireductor indicus]EKF44053.1 hypothetical protein NA8A_04555 [Nitratireductor indicus C115]SFQ11228.1 hypothetical protein SAMN05216176_101398 [Nitratireductor indicus]
MADTAREEAAHKGTILFSPAFVLAVVALVLAAILLLPVNVPIGSMYWDLFIYFDAANRLFSGQIPATDFFAPVGPLGYYLFAGGLKLFAKAQPLLLVHWSLFVITAPLMALGLAEISRTSRKTAFAILVPFLIFAVLPFNTREFFPFPGSDGFGIYNRQVCQLLYALTVSLIYLRSQRLLFIAILAGMTALFLTKITGFAAGGLLCLFAFLAGRVTFKTALATAIGFLLVLCLLQLWNGFALNYIGDILALVALNEDSLAPRFLQAASLTFGIVLPATALILFLLYEDRTALIRDLRALGGLRPAAVARFLDRDAFWIGAVLTIGIFFETQNTGSQALIFLWPAILPALISLWKEHGPDRVFATAALLAAAAALPPVVNTAERAARTYVGAVKNVALPSRNLKTLGRVNMRPEILARAQKMLDFYADHRATYADFIRIQELPAYMFYSEFDFQAAHLMAIDRAITDIETLEAEKGVRFETILNLNFVNPFPWLLDRQAPEHVAIGADPTRAVPQPGEEALEAVRETDLILHPTCPLTTANADLLKLYEPAMRNHKRVELDKCFDAYVSPRLADLVE